MKKFLCILLSLMLLAAAGAAFAEEEEGDGAGEVIVLEDLEEISEELLEDSEPYVPDDADKAVFGKDDRVTVRNPSQYPYSAIAYMDVHAKCGCTWTCNGFMTDKDRLLTAAQCLMCEKHSKWADRITFYFGYKNSRNYSYKYTGGWSAYVGNDFSGGFSTSYNYGIMKLDKNIGNSTGWFGTHWGWSDSQLESKYLYVAGYQDGGTMKYDSGYVNAQDSQRMVFRFDVGRGCAGGPIFGTDDYAVGIMIADNSSNNIGYRLTSSMYKEYQKKK